jgi:hypothetical protein
MLRANELLSTQIPRIAQRAERIVLRVLVAAGRAETTAAPTTRSALAASGIRLAPDDPQLMRTAVRESRQFHEGARIALRRGDMAEAVGLQTRAFGANPVECRDRRQPGLGCALRQVRAKARRRDGWRCTPDPARLEASLGSDRGLEHLRHRQRAHRPRARCAQRLAGGAGPFGRLRRQCARGNRCLRHVRRGHCAGRSRRCCKRANATPRAGRARALWRMAAALGRRARAERTVRRRNFPPAPDDRMIEGVRLAFVRRGRTA